MATVKISVVTRGWGGERWGWRDELEEGEEIFRAKKRYCTTWQWWIPDVTHLAELCELHNTKSEL